MAAEKPLVKAEHRRRAALVMYRAQDLLIP
jgi:hypothetical protein